MKRRLLAMVLSLAMLMGLLPTAALAAGSGGPSGGAPYQDLGQREEGAVSAAKFTIYKDGVKGDSPKENVQAGQLSETAPDLTGENLYFDHAEVNGKRVYEAGTLTGQDITYYGSISGALSILGENGLSINLYTILFIAFFGIGYGAYYATADMPIPMVADCSDYETYRSGKYIPGIMGTLFSLVDKLVSSLSATVVGIAVSFVGLQSLPTQYDPYTPGMNWVVIVLFCIIPMVAWAATLIAMKGYTLTGVKMKEIQAVNACRRDAVAKGMKLEEAMDKWQTMDQLPAEYRS